MAELVHQSVESEGARGKVAQQSLPVIDVQPDVPCRRARPRKVCGRKHVQAGKGARKGNPDVANRRGSVGSLHEGQVCDVRPCLERADKRSLLVQAQRGEGDPRLLIRWTAVSGGAVSRPAAGGAGKAVDNGRTGSHCRAPFGSENEAVRQCVSGEGSGRARTPGGGRRHDFFLFCFRFSSTEKVGAAKRPSVHARQAYPGVLLESPVVDTDGADTGTPD